MAERASHASKPSESDFHDSHPLDEDLSPSLGDLTDIDSLPDSKSSRTQSVGDLNSVDNQDEDDVLGDITLLEEAFAEMDDDELASDDMDTQDNDVDIASKLASHIPDEESLEGADEIDIPVLDEAVDEPTSDSEPASAAEINETIPVLEQEATVFAPSEGDDSALKQLLDDDHPSSTEIDEVNNDASVFVEPENNGSISVSEFDPAATSFAEIDAEAEVDVQTSVDILSDTDIADVEDSDVISQTVDDKIAQLASERAETEINEIPVTRPVSEFDLSEVEPDPYSDLPTEFAEGLNSAPLSTIASRFEHSQPSHAAHTVQVGQNSGFSLNIPFELHTQLSKKIDALVIEATTSLTNELHEHLNERLDILLGQAVEAVLPNLVDQMLNGLRKEVKLKVKQQLPVIINEVLGKTSLKDK